MNNLLVNSESLRWHCDPAQFQFNSTAELPPLEMTIGQERALTAIDFGLGITDNGFNLFVLGQPGSGRSSTIKKILAAHATQKPAPADWCYVHDFESGSGPEFICLPHGTGKEFKKDLDRLVERLSEDVPKSFDSKEYQEQRKKISQSFQERRKQIFQDLDQLAADNGFAIQQVASGLVLVPLKEGSPISQKDFEELPAKDKERLENTGNMLQEKIDEGLREVRKIDEELREKILDVAKQVLLYTIGHLFEALELKYATLQPIINHFANCKKDILKQIEDLHSADKPQFNLPGLTPQQQGPNFDNYRVNLLIDNSELDGAPVIYEANPTYFNVFGRIEHVILMGSAVTDFQMIKPGAMHRANGGYLILDCREVLLNLFTYEALKRSIRNKEIKLEDMAEQYRLIATASLKPQPIPLECKIVLIGTPELYYLLYQLDPDFRKYFKVKVDFDQRMANSSANIQLFSLFIGTKCREEKLLHFDPAAVAHTIEFSARMIEDQKYLSASFSEITDLIHEASFYADRSGASLVTAAHVDQALESRIYRANKTEEHIRALIEDGTIFIDTQGQVVGQVNGLTVYQLGDYSFGMPARVTVRTFLGKSNMINIEREVKLSGPIHDKGMLILSGFFGERYGCDKPLALSASICFEQSYGGIEGDSASSTELYALLSSLARLPIRQDIAVTGSVNQHGRVQPIGGVNQKIEGFFAVCKANGLTGNQGVIIPRANVKNLMLKAEVERAVQSGQFHIWSVETIDEGIAILTGVAAGELQDDGTWPEGSVNDRVNGRLLQLVETAAEFGKKAAGHDTGNGKTAE